MDPLRIVVRIVFMYAVLLMLVRLSGKRTVKQGRPFDFVISLIVGDMMDDLMWAEVSAPVFTVAVSSLFLVHTVMDLLRFRSAE